METVTDTDDGRITAGLLTRGMTILERTLGGRIVTRASVLETGPCTERANVHASVAIVRNGSHAGTHTWCYYSGAKVEIQ